MSRRFDRRWFLRGFGGALIGLPLLEAMSSGARAQPFTHPRRFVVFFEHGGTLSGVSKTGARFDGKGDETADDGWRPASAAETLQLGPIHQPLQGHTSSLLLLRGIDNRSARVQVSLDGDHGWCNATALTCAQAFIDGASSESQKVADGPSIDAVLAERLANRFAVPVPAIHLKVSGVTYGTPFYRAARQPILAQPDPVAAFDALFQGVVPAGAAEEPAAARARALRRSILDGTADMVKVFQKRMGARDRQTLEAHLEHLRALEQKVEKLSVPMVPGCEVPQVAPGAGTADVVAPAHVDLLVAALRCGLTNVGALEIGDVETPWLNPPLASPDANAHTLHHLSSSAGEAGFDAARRADWVATMIQNRQWRMTQLARLLDALKAVPEGEGTMLDHTLVLWTSEFSNGGAHSAADIPVLLAGGSSAQLRMGRHLDFNQHALHDPTTRAYETRASLHNLYTSLLNAFGYGDAHFGNQDAYVPGPLSGLG